MCFIVFIRFKAAYFTVIFTVMIWRLIFFISRFMSVYLIRNSWKVSEKLLFTFVLLVCTCTCMVTSPLPVKGCKNEGLCSKATARRVLNMQHVLWHWAALLMYWGPIFQPESPSGVFSLYSCLEYQSLVWCVYWYFLIIMFFPFVFPLFCYECMAVVWTYCFRITL